MSIRLVAMDLDDTLLHDDWTISERTVEAIKKARSKGVKMTIATGRMPIATKPYAEQLGLDVPVITYHGAMIQQVLSGEIIYRQVIPVKSAREIVGDLLRQNVHVQIYLQDRVLTQKKNDWSRYYERVSKVTIEETDLDTALAQETQGVEKILLIGEESDLAKFVEPLNQAYGQEINITKSKAFFLELIEKKVNKGVALQALAKSYGIKKDEVMAIGDSFNDLAMLEYAGLGVAMGNARAEVKETADIITGTNEEDGVAQAIERYVLG